MADVGVGGQLGGERWALGKRSPPRKKSDGVREGKKGGEKRRAREDQDRGSQKLLDRPSKREAEPKPVLVCGIGEDDRQGGAQTH
jgi:hypothetical protein